MASLQAISPSNSSRSDETWLAVLERALDLTPREQLRLFAELRDYLSLVDGQTTADTKVNRQLAALAVLEQVSAHLGLPDREAPTMAEFDRGSAELGLTWNGQQVARSFGGYKIAVAVFAGDRPQPSSGQEAKRRAALARRRTREEYCAALRVWLKESPVRLGSRDYDAFARGYNRDADLALPSASAIKKGLTLRWVDCLRVARHEVTLAEVAQKEIATREARTSGPDDLIGVREAGLMLEAKMTHAWNLSRTLGFPPPALILAGKRMFLREHVDAYVQGRRQWSHASNYLRPRYYDVKELGAAIGMRHSLISVRRSENQCPPRTGSASGKNYWLVEDVERWIADHQDLVAQRRERNS